MLKPSLNELQKFTDKYNIVPVCKEIFSDVRTPINVLLALKHISSTTYLLESAETNERWGRYSFLGFNPSLEISCKNHQMTIKGAVTTTFKTDNPAQEIRKILNQYKSPKFDFLPTFTGGLVGYFAYEYIRYSEPKLDFSDSEDISFNDVDYGNDRRSVIVLGSGAYRIGSSVEFDWCSVNALQTIRNLGWRGVMINYNPETVSTDYDMCDRLYFDELTFERVMDIYDLENPHGVVVSVGGQIPNNLALKLDRNGVPILGTSAEDIDRAEDRNKFSSIVDELGIDQPKWKELTTFEDVDRFVEEVGFPVLVRPSYVLSGAAMNVCYNRSDLEDFLNLAAQVSKKHPVVISEFIQGAKEIEFDAVADGGEVLAYAISEHVEFAGVHSGDATIQFPPQKLYVETVRRIKKIAKKIAGALHISGPFNIQFLAKNNQIKVIECNLRASRSFPFVSKVLKINLIELATKVMMGERPRAPHKSAFDLDYVGVKASQFSFSRLQQADPVLGVDMASTGEVGCIGDTFDEALIKSILSVGYDIPKKNILISSGDARQKAEMLNATELLVKHGYRIYATGGTHKYLSENGIESVRVLWPSEAEHPSEEEKGLESALDMLQHRKIDLVINITKNFSRAEISNGYLIRRAATDLNIPLITNARLATAFIRAFCELPLDKIEIKSWDEY